MAYYENGKNLLKVIYTAGFIFTVHAALLSYINSSFLSGYVGTAYVGIIFTAAAALSLITLNKIPEAMPRFGNRRLSLSLMVVEMAILLGLALTKSPVFIVLLFMSHYAVLNLLRFNFDVFVERLSSDSCTGNIRGTFLTAVNLGWLVSPFIAGSILSDSDFWKIYLIASALLIPVFIIIYSNFKSAGIKIYDHPPFWQTVKKVWENKNIYRIYMANFLLQFFFAWMVIYTPIYLNQYIGFGWSQIGIIFSVMLLPYVLFEIPFGRLADRWLGEKELLSAGFVLTAISTASLAFITEHSVAIWALLLFITRIGASAVEIMSESYFFKQVDDTDVNLISFFRNSHPFSYLVAPIIATIFLIFFPYKYLFVFLALIMLYGLRYSISLKDTR